MRADASTTAGVYITGHKSYGCPSIQSWDITGNQIQTRANERAVLLAFSRGDTNFSDNHVERRGGGDNADVVLSANTLVVNANRVQTGGLSMDLKTGDQHYTVLGNICRGRILVNGAAIIAPWAPLNRQNV